MKRLFLAFTALFLMSAQVWGELTWNWNSSTKTMTISGSGAMANYTSTTRHSALSTDSRYSSVEKIIITEGVTSIGNFAFRGCTKLDSVAVLSPVTTIGESAFMGCTKLRSVKLPKELSTINKGAFYNCTTLVALHVASPNDWAKVNFVIDASVNNYTAVPFYASTASTRQFFFNGKNTATTMLVFTPGITEIKPYAFYHATGIKGVNLPNSVETIGAHAFDCSIGTNVAINRTTPPTTGDKAFSFVDNTVNTYLYLPEGASSSYIARPWYYNGGTKGTGAYKVGYQTDAVVSSEKITVGSEQRNLYLTSGKCGENISWTLQNDGTLVLEGSGDMPAYSSDNEATNCPPWWRFRYLVHKAVIRGASSEQQITDIKNALKWCYAITSITVEQSTIPEIDIDLNASEFLSDVVEISVPLADLNAEALTQEPWKSMDIKLSEPLVIDETKEINTWSGYNKLAGDEVEQLNIIRSLSHDYYNTFCSPVSGDVATLLGEDAEVYAFTAVSGDAETGYTFTFSPLDGDIVAGVPYLVKPSSDIAQIELTNVAISRLTTTPQTVTHDGFSFCGVLAPTNLSGGEYILGNGDLLYKALPGQMKGMRAYFTLPAQSGVAPRVSMNILSQTNTPTGWQAQKHNSTIQKKLHNGRLLILRDKKTYDILGNKQ